MGEYVGALGFGGFMIGFLLGFFLSNSTDRRDHFVPDLVADPKQMAEPNELSLPTEIRVHFVDYKPTEHAEAGDTSEYPPPGTQFNVLQDCQIVGHGIVGENDHPGWREPNINWGNIQLPEKD